MNFAFEFVNVRSNDMPIRVIFRFVFHAVRVTRTPKIDLAPRSFDTPTSCNNIYICMHERDVYQKRNSNRKVPPVRLFKRITAQSEHWQWRKLRVRRYAHVPVTKRYTYVHIRTHLYKYICICVSVYFSYYSFRINSTYTLYFRGTPSRKLSNLLPEKGHRERPVRIYTYVRKNQPTCMKTRIRFPRYKRYIARYK